MSSISGTDRQSVQSPGAGVGLQLPASLQQALDPQQVQRDLSTLLERAGLERAPDGTIAVKDTAALGKTGEVQGLSAREQVYGAGETQLKPPGPPKIELNKELRAGAETFARNIDVAFNNIFKKGVGASDATAPGGVTGPTTTQQDDIRRMAELSADVLLAAFLKLNISDPNNSVETHNKLHEIMTDLRQKAIDDARAKIETAQAQMKEAQEYAEKAQYVSTVLQVVMIAVTLILTAVTFGAGAVLFVAVAMVIGAMIGQMTSGDALGGASIAGSIASFGVSAAASAAAQAAQKIAEEVAKEAIKQGQAITQQTINKMVQEIIKKMSEQGVKVTQETLTKAVQQAVAKQAQAVGTQITQGAINTMVSQAMTVNAGLLTGVIQAAGKLSLGAFRFLMTAAQTGSTVTQSYANTKAGEMALEAQQTQVEAKRARTRAEMFQNQLQEESEIIKMIMESKNQVVDAVIKMMNAMFASSQKLMSAGMAKG